MSLKVLKDWTGTIIGNVTVLRRTDNNKIRVVRTGEEHRPKLAWDCLCMLCNTIWSVPHANISTNSPSSCYQCANRKPTSIYKIPRSQLFIKKNHPSYGSWYSMIRRCTSTKHVNYPRYGGRGITVCEAWYDFDQFVLDMGVRPTGKTIDRIDNDKGYYKENCKWSTPVEQRANQRAPVKRKRR